MEWVIIDDDNSQPVIHDFSIQNEEKVKPGENITSKMSKILNEKVENFVIIIIHSS